MTKTEYSNGGTPKVGDIVRPAIQNTFEYNSFYKRPSPNYEYIVVEVTEGSRSTLVSFKGYNENAKHHNHHDYDSPLVKSTNLELIRRDSNNEYSTNVPKYIIWTEGDNGHGLLHNEDQLKKRLDALLSKNPQTQYHVFEYKASAVTKPLVVTMVDARKLQAEPKFAKF